MSARSYLLKQRKFGNVKVFLTGRNIVVKLHGYNVISLDLILGKLSINHHGHATQSTAACINRFFRLVEINRFSVSRSVGRLIFHDSKLNTSKEILSGLAVSAPVKSVLICLRSMDLLGSLAEEWVDEMFDRGQREQLIVSYGDQDDIGF